jgi:hypothetical protein
VDLVKKAFPDVSSDSQSARIRGVTSAKSNKGTSHRVLMARLSHFALCENWGFYPKLTVRFFRDVFFVESTRDYTVLM